MKKTTQELLELLKNGRLQDYLKNNSDEMVDEPLCCYLNACLEEKNLTKASVIEKSGIFNIYAYQIFAGKRIPSRDKLIALCMGMELTIEETQTMLQYAGYATLYPRNKRDSVILSALQSKLSVIRCNLLLDEMGCSPL